MEQVYNILDHIRLHKILHYNKPNNKGQKMKKKKKTQLKLKKGRKKKKRVHHKTTKSPNPTNLPSPHLHDKNHIFPNTNNTQKTQTRKKKEKTARGENYYNIKRLKSVKLDITNKPCNSLPVTVAHSLSSLDLDGVGGGME